jgi:bacterioferritin
MNENWGYFRLAQHYRKESFEEMVHAEKLMARILFLESVPNMVDIGPIRVGANVKAQFENDLALELAAVQHLNQAIKDARDLDDNASRALFEEILVDEEEHVDYLEGQLHALEQIGLANYLAQHLHRGEESEAD